MNILRDILFKIHGDSFNLNYLLQGEVMVERTNV